MRVRYAETDQMGVVYHANYLVWFEVGRVELLREHGITYKDIEIEEQAGMAVVEASLRYKSPARYDDELIIQTEVLMARTSLIRFAYRITRAADGQLLCTGETVHVVVGRDMKRRSISKRYADLLGLKAAHHREA